MTLTPESQKLLNWMGPTGAKTLQEILNWGPWAEPDFDHVKELCGKLVEAGYLKMSVMPDGAIVYRVVFNKEQK